MENPDSQSSRFRPWLSRIVRLLIAVVVLLAVAGLIYENISEARDRRFNPMPGKLVDVSERKMHIYCAGQGSPTVILESGLGDSYISWRKVQPQISKFTRVCSYDRAGLGYSDPSSGPRTSKVMAEQLHALLRAASVPVPYVLVGHSMGGFDVRLFTSLYRSEVAGMVLVDASHPDQENRFPAQLKKMEGGWQREAEFLEYTMPLGIPRWLGACDDSPTARAADCNWHSAREQVSEMKSFSTSAAEAGATGSLGDLPLIVLSHDPDKPSSEFPPDLAKDVNQAWEQMQEDLAHLSTRGSQVIVRDSSHYIQIDNPAAVVEAVRRVVDQVPHGPSAAPNH